jgi:hypothetical protein
MPSVLIKKTRSSTSVSVSRTSWTQLSTSLLLWSLNGDGFVPLSTCQESYVPVLMQCTSLSFRSLRSTAIPILETSSSARTLSTPRRLKSCSSIMVFVRSCPFMNVLPSLRSGRLWLIPSSALASPQMFLSLTSSAKSTQRCGGVFLSWTCKLFFSLSKPFSPIRSSIIAHAVSLNVALLSDTIQATAKAWGVTFDTEFV